MNQLSNRGLKVTDVILDISFPEDGQTVHTLTRVQNFDNVSYNNLRVELTLNPVDQEGPRSSNSDPIKIGETNIDTLAAQDVISLEMEFQAVAGEYSLVAIIIFQNIEIMSSKYTMNLQILQAKQGDNLTVIVALLGITIFIFGVITLQPVYDKMFRIRKNGKSKNKKN